MATHYETTKNGVYVQIYSYLSNNSSKSNKLGTPLIPRQTSFVVGYANYLISYFMNINENLRNERIIFEKIRSIRIQLSMADLLCVLVYQA